MRRLWAALRIVPPAKFRAERDPGQSLHFSIASFEHVLDPGCKREFSKELARRSVLIVRLLFTQGRITKLGTTCPRCKFTEQSTFSSLDAAQKAPPCVCIFCGESYIRVGNLCYPDLTGGSMCMRDDGEGIEEVD